MTNPLILKNGKFYRNGEIVPLEFGNKEQIALMKQENEYLQELSGDGIYVEVDTEEISVYRSSTYITCKCGHVIHWESSDYDDEESAENAIEDEEKKCRSCGKEYILIYSKDDDEWRVKLKPSKKNG